MKILKKLFGGKTPKEETFEEKLINAIKENEKKEEERYKDHYRELIEENNKLLNHLIRKLGE